MGSVPRRLLDSDTLGLDLSDTLVDGVPRGAAAVGSETAEVSPGESSGVRRKNRSEMRRWSPDRPSDPACLLGTRVSGRYELRAVLGTGGMGAVYHARDLHEGVDVAIKILRAELAGNAEATHRFLREARTTASLDHPNIVRTIEAGLEPGSGLLFLVMERLEGETAEEALERRGKFPLDEALRIAAAVLRGLSAAHQAGVIHRDLKPANVFLTGSTVKLIDFGIAKSAKTTGPFKLTTPGVVLGTPQYLSPEQARGEPNLDARVDVYAVGILLYELLSGQLPFDHPCYMQVIAAICREAPPPLAARVPGGVPPEVEAIIATAMHKDRTQRFPSAVEMLEAIDALAAGAGGSI
jgi:eukaryotic-like serine/threonine-protein kinase